MRLGLLIAFMIQAPAGGIAQGVPAQSIFTIKEIGSLPAENRFCGATYLPKSMTTVTCHWRNLTFVREGGAPRIVPVDTSRIRLPMVIRAIRDTVRVLARVGPSLSAVNEAGIVVRNDSLFRLPVKIGGGGGYKYVTTFDNGRVLIIDRGHGANPVTVLSRGGELRDTARLLVVGSRIDTVGTLVMAGEYSVVIDRAIYLVDAPLVRRRLVAGVADRFVTAYSDRYEIAVFSPSGGRLGTIRQNPRNQPITDVERQRVLREYVANGDSIRRPFRQKLVQSLTRTPPVWPELASLTVDQLGRVWAGRMGPRGCEWDVYSRQLQLTSTVRAPCGFNVLDAAGDILVAAIGDRVVTARMLPAK